MKDLVLPDPSKGEAVMEILEPLGAGRFLARGYVEINGKEEEIIAKVFVPGKMKRRRRSRINPGDYVLVSLRYSESEKEWRGEIRMKYTKDQVKKLIKMGIIKEEEEGGIEF